MAGFFGLFDFTKEGPGISDEKPRKGLLLFLRIFKNNFWKLMTLNLLFLLFCLPVVTIPAAYTAMTRVLRDMIDEKPVFIWLDFRAAFKENFIQSLFCGILFAIVNALGFWGVSYLITARGDMGFILIGGLFLLSLLMFSFISLYIPLMIVSVKQRLTVMYNNAIRLSFIALWRNLLTVIILFILNAVHFIFFPYSAIFVLLLLFSTTGLIICFNSWPIIKKYVIRQ